MDWGDGAKSVHSVSRTGSAITHTYADDGVMMISAKVTSTAGEVGSARAFVKVLNVAPSFEAISVDAVSENGYALLTATIEDPGALDTFTITLDWG